MIQAPQPLTSTPMPPATPVMQSVQATPPSALLMLSPPPTPTEHIFWQTANMNKGILELSSTHPSFLDCKMVYSLSDEKIEALMKMVDQWKDRHIQNHITIYDLNQEIHRSSSRAHCLQNSLEHEKRCNQVLQRDNAGIRSSNEAYRRDNALLLRKIAKLKRKVANVTARSPLEARPAEAKFESENAADFDKAVLKWRAHFKEHYTFAGVPSNFSSYLFNPKGERNVPQLVIAARNQSSLYYNQRPANQSSTHWNSLSDEEKTYWKTVWESMKQVQHHQLEMGLIRFRIPARKRALDSA